MYFSDRILNYLNDISFDARLPDGINVMNPYKDENVKRIIKAFYHKFFEDNLQRTLILGINPGRFGAGSTGIAFTDSKRLESVCRIEFNGTITHEPSSVFVYKIIESYGGAEKFYKKFFIHAICPLGFTKTQPSGKVINYNYYDNKELLTMTEAFIISNIRELLKMNISSEVCVCLGKGNNYAYFNKLNSKYGFFKKIVFLEHPRYIIQYKASKLDDYVNQYLNVLENI